MVWWKLEVFHGPGHCSHDTKYFWLEDEPDEEWLENLTEGFCDRRGLHNTVAKWEKLVRLPEEVRLTKTVRALGTLKRAERSLKILEASRNAGAQSAEKESEDCSSDV